MSLTKRSIEERQKQEQLQIFNKLLEVLIEKDYLSHETSKGISRQVIKKGLDSLTNKQRELYLTNIKPFVEAQCEFCKNDVPIEELIILYENNESILCSRCQK